MSKPKKKKKKRVNPMLVVCGRCGSKKIEMLSWTDPNTLKFKSWVEGGNEEEYCNKCEDHVAFTNLRDFKDEQNKA
jgi:hypothetical protein